MFDWRKYGTAPAAFIAPQVVALLFALRLQQPRAWLGAALVLVAISAVAWIISYRRVRHIGDTPTSKVASAAQGYTEFFGHALQHEGHKLLSKHGRIECVWYRYRVQRTDKKNSIVESGISQDSFLLHDRTGTCTVDPEKAEVVTEHKRSWTVGNLRYTEEYIFPYDPLYALGEYATLRNSDSDYDLNAGVNDRLNELKRDKATLLQRFDANGDGEIDLKEWELARREAASHALKERQELLSQPGIPILREPEGRRLFLLSTRHPGQLQTRYKLWAAFHFFAMLSSAGVAAYVALNYLNR